MPFIGLPGFGAVDHGILGLSLQRVGGRHADAEGSDSNSDARADTADMQMLEGRWARVAGCALCGFGQQLRQRGTSVWTSGLCLGLVGVVSGRLTATSRTKLMATGIC